MANIKDLKKRIRSTGSTLKITSAMKLVSAAKLAKAQGRINGFKPYSSELDKTVRISSALAEKYSHKFFEENESSKVGLLVISADRGLCGAYNSQVFKLVRRFLEENKGKEIELYFIGKKVRELLLRDKSLKETKTFTYKKFDPTFDEAKAIGDELSQKFLNNELGRVYIASNSFVSAMEFGSKVIQALPMAVSEEEKADLNKNFPVDFKYEPTAEEILNKLVPEVYTTTLFTCMLDAIAAEHGARMTAMDSASKNSKDMIKTLTLKMNKLRQAAITTELSEIVSGAESLNG